MSKELDMMLYIKYVVTMLCLPIVITLAIAAFLGGQSLWWILPCVVILGFHLGVSLTECVEEFNVRTRRR